MKTICHVIFLTMSLSASAATNDLESAVLSFPESAVWEYRPDLAVQAANTFIVSNPSRAIKALEAVAKARRPFSEGYEVDQKLCHLCSDLCLKRNH